MDQISKIFYSSNSEPKNNIYIDIIIEILINHREEPLSIYNILQIYSITCKKRIEEIMNNRIDIANAINQIKNNDNIMCYYYCKNDKIYYLFMYTITPNIRYDKNND